MGFDDVHANTRLLSFLLGKQELLMMKLVLGHTHHSKFQTGNKREPGVILQLILNNGAKILLPSSHLRSMVFKLKSKIFENKIIFFPNWNFINNENNHMSFLMRGPSKSNKPKGQISRFTRASFNLWDLIPVLCMGRRM